MEFPPVGAHFSALLQPAPRPLGKLATRLVAGVFALLLGCGGDGDAAESGWNRDPETVEVMRIQAEPLVDVATFSGQLDAEHSVMVKPEIGGVVATIGFQQGQRVAEGDVLFRLRNAEQEARLREAEANRDLALQGWKRAQQLLTRDASSKAQADVAKAEYEIAQARVDLARVELERTAIRAPFDGVVGLREVDLGDRVDDETELARLDSVDRLQATFGIPDIGLPFARTGMKVDVWVRPYPGEKFPGEVFFVSPSLDPRNRRILVKAWIDNSEGRLAPGLFANVDLELRSVDSALLVPESAVAQDEQGTFVWVVDENRVVSRRPIETGLREGGIVEVTQGLSEGVEIVTAGVHKLSEGASVQVAGQPIVERVRRTQAEGTLLGEGT